MIWHDCKTDPPKEYKDYLLCYFNNFLKLKKYLTIAKYSLRSNQWSDFRGFIENPYKWAEVDLSEVE